MGKTATTEEKAARAAKEKERREKRRKRLAEHQIRLGRSIPSVGNKNRHKAVMGFRIVASSPDKSPVAAIQSSNTIGQSNVCDLVDSAMLTAINSAAPARSVRGGWPTSFLQPEQLPIIPDPQVSFDQLSAVATCSSVNVNRLGMQHNCSVGPSVATDDKDSSYNDQIFDDFAPNQDNFSMSNLPRPFPRVLEQDASNLAAVNVVDTRIEFQNSAEQYTAESCSKLTDMIEIVPEYLALQEVVDELVADEADEITSVLIQDTVTVYSDTYEGLHFDAALQDESTSRETTDNIKQAAFLSVQHKLTDAATLDVLKLLRQLAQDLKSNFSWIPGVVWLSNPDFHYIKWGLKTFPLCI